MEILHGFKGSVDYWILRTYSAVIWRLRSGNSSALIYYSAPDRGIGERSIVTSVSVCVFVSAIISSEPHVRPSPIFCAWMYGSASVLLWGCSDVLHMSGYITMPHLHISWGCSTANIAARLRQWGSHADLGLGCRNTHCRQWMRGTASCSQGLLGRSGHAAYLRYHVWNIMFPHIDEKMTCSK